MKRIAVACLILLVLTAFGAVAETAAPFSLSVEETLPDDELPAAMGGDGPQVLMEGYIEKVLYPSAKAGYVKAPRLVGAGLTGTDRALYLGLSERIACVAAGTLAETAFAFSVEDVYDQWTFTAEELGVEAILEDGAYTAQAKAAISRAVKCFDSTGIVKALLADCPYELYWYDKTSDGGCRVSYPTYSTDGTAVTLKGSVVFRMTVAQDYAAGDYLVDTSYGQAVHAAAENARSIVEQYEDLADCDRLLAYKDEICALTAYNFDAAAGQTAYGNPWQLIWVFDGDPETKVVCEGYAKAFQYLNDLSASAVTVISPIGRMNGVSHMWNVVAMEDGKNYLVDVTNCDSGMVGYPDRLFLAGCASGSVAEGYLVAAGTGTCAYTYDESRAFSDDELTLAPWNYAAGGPPTPVFTAQGPESLYVNETLPFEYGGGYVYDELIARVARVLPDGEETDEILQSVGLSDSIWRFRAGDWGAGDYSVSFAGVRDGVESPWSEPTGIHVSELEDMIPTYTFSTDRGYVGYRLAIRLDTEADGVIDRDTGEAFPCEDRIALIPLTEAGEITYALAVVWNGTRSGYGAETAVSVSEAGSGALNIPDGTRTIEEEAFQGAAPAVVVVPDSVAEIGARAFADNDNLRLVKLGAARADETAFENCPNVVFCVKDAALGFAKGERFLTE